MSVDEMLLSLGELVACDSSRTGSKAAVLASLKRAGLPVLDGIVLTVQAYDLFSAQVTDPDGASLPVELHQALSQVVVRYASRPLAVRSSAIAEDLPDATFAGQYETVLDVCGPTALEEAVRRCWISLSQPALEAYRQRSGTNQRPAMAVLIQPMIQADAAGVALGADPITGDRTKVLVSAVRGNPAALVSGAVVPEDWEIGATGAFCRTPNKEVLTADQVTVVARLLRRIESLQGAGPQDIEWALVGGQPFILQARPMAALPPETHWIAPLPGGWLRNIRLGEWLPEPITPLFETWLLERIEERFRLCQAADGGIEPPPPLHVCVNGWYFHSPIGSGKQGVLWRGLLRRPRPAVATLVASRLPSVADRLFYRAFARRWPTDVLTPYQRLVTDAQLHVEQADPAELMQIVDKAAAAAGEFFWSFTVCGGAAWRFEKALAKFYDRYLKSAVPQPYQTLLGGLAPADTPGHFVYSIDWVRETLGELSATAANPKSMNARQEQASAERVAAEALCRRYLAAHPKKAARFGSLLAITQHYAVIREQHGRWFTLAWPLLRRCAYLLGANLASAGVLDSPDDIFFIVRAELEDCLAGRFPERLAVRALQRRADWERQRMLAAPLRLGKAPFILSRLLLPSSAGSSSSVVEGDNALHGTPASPGYAVGPVRVLRGPAAASEVQPGDVLVVSAAVPALTPLFDRIAALCVDSGSVAAHASLIAREYGIPAVTGIGNATTRLVDQSVVAVNGTTGVVELL